MSYLPERRLWSVSAWGAMAWVVIALSGCSGDDNMTGVLATGGSLSQSSDATDVGGSGEPTSGGSSSNESSGGSSSNDQTGTGGTNDTRTGGGGTGGAGQGGNAITGGTGPAGGTLGQGGATTATGGRSTGGAATGGKAMGGAATGGRATGGAATGGRATGGAAATGGKATGGKATGGIGGAAAGGTTGTSVAAQYVDAINAVRAAVTAPANYSGTWTPLPNVTWSDTVAASAQAWATNLATTQNCGLTHEDQDQYGENLAAGTRLTPQSAVNLWAGEKDKYVYSATYSLADFNAGSGHYTQLVWRTSIQVGCGSASCSNNVVVISCRFSPPGNYIGKSVY